MNVTRLNREIKIALAEFGTERVDWTTAPDYRIIIRRVPLPRNITAPASDMMFRVPADFGHTAGPGRIRFLRDVYLDPDLRVREPRTGHIRPIPRYHDQPLPGTRWHFLCIHKPGTAVDERTTILDFIRTVQLFLANCLTSR